VKEQKFFGDAEVYNQGMGRLSRLAGERFLDWISLPGGLRWLDVGCGPGTFTELLLDLTAPSAISAVDPSDQTIAFAKGKPSASRIDYRQGDAMSLPFGDAEFDAAVMALVIQYVPDRAKAMTEISRVVRPGGTIAAYVWAGPNEGHPLQPVRDAVRSIGGPEAGRPGNQIRSIDSLVDLFSAAGLEGVDSCPIEIQLDFKDFDDFWSVQTAEYQDMTASDEERLKASLRERFPTDESGRIRYMARANAVKGRVPS